MPLLTVICGALSFPIGIFYSLDAYTWVFVSEILHRIILFVIMYYVIHNVSGYITLSEKTVTQGR